MLLAVVEVVFAVFRALGSAPAGFYEGDGRGHANVADARPVFCELYRSRVVP